ncbi:MAG: HDOD domain-containing protein, partial [Pseudomonadota bacterium]
SSTSSSPATPASQEAAQTLAAAIESGKIDVPVLPETAHRVITLIQDPDSDASQLSSIIQSDPTMVGHIMRIANSVAYTPNANLISVQQAVARLGMVEISNIAFSTSLNGKMFNAPGYENDIHLIWLHALATALWSKEVARSMRSNVEAAFLCGLLHSIGQPVILQTLADGKTGATALTDNELTQLYKQFEQGYADAVVKEWGLPAIVCEAIKYYQHFADAPGEPELAATIAFGHQLAHLMLHPEHTEKDSIIHSPALELINLYPDEVEALIEKTPSIHTAMDTLLS